MTTHNKLFFQKKITRKNGFTMTELVMSVTAGSLLMLGSGVALRSTGTLIENNKFKTILRQNTSNGMRLMRSEIESLDRFPFGNRRQLGDGTVLAFFSLKEYERWRASVGAREEHRWRTKYYKGLGTSTSTEARDYFAALPEHRVQLE